MTLPRPSITASVVAAFVLVSVVLTALVSPPAPAATGTGAPAGPAAGRPITQADLVCPVPATAKGVSQAVLTAAASGAARASGTLSLYRLGGSLAAPPLAEVALGGSTLRYPVPVGKATTLVLRATGTYAPGLTAAVTTRVASGPGRSLQSAPCTAAGGDDWFVGGGASVGRRSVLLLTNVDAAPATVDVSLYTPTGLQQPTPVQGVTVQPRSQMSFALDLLVPGAGATVVHVATRSGRVAAALSDSLVNGLRPQGADWVPTSIGPSRSGVIVGIPGDADASQTLTLATPGPDDALVNVHLVTSQGTLSPQDLQGISAPSGKLTTVTIPAAEAGGPFAVVVEADHGVVAGVRTVRTPTGAGATGKAPEFSYAATVPPIEAPVVLSGVTRTATQSTVLELAAPGDSDVAVGLTTTTGGVSTTTRVTVTAGTAVRVTVGPAPAAGAAPASRTLSSPTLSSIDVQTVKGAAPLYVGWVQSEAGVSGPLVTGGSLPQTPLTLLLPAVAADPAVGYAGH